MVNPTALEAVVEADPGALARLRHGLSLDGQALLDEIVADGSLRARGAYGFWTAQADGDDVVLDDGTHSRAAVPSGA